MILNYKSITNCLFNIWYLSGLVESELTRDDKTDGDLYDQYLSKRRKQSNLRKVNDFKLFLYVETRV